MPIESPEEKKAKTSEEKKTKARVRKSKAVQADDEAEEVIK